MTLVGPLFHSGLSNLMVYGYQARLGNCRAGAVASFIHLIIEGHTVSCARHAALIALFAATSVLAQGGGFPKAPVNLKEAEAQGLQRLSVEDLKAFMPGTLKFMGTKGKSTGIFKPDGNFQRKAFHDFSDSWRFDQGKNGYCVDVYKQRDREQACFATFRAAETDYYFDYDFENGFYSRTWTPAKAE